MDGPANFRTSLISFLLFVAVALAWLLFLLAKGGQLPSIGGDGYNAKVLLPTSSSLTSGARVTMAGVKVGKVTSVDRQGVGAVADISIDDSSVTPLPRDSRVRLRQATPIGENYVSITPGRSAQKLPKGGTLDLSQADEYTDVDQILSVLRGQTRDRARQTIRGLGGALRGHGADLNQLVRSVNALSPAGGRTTRILYPRRQAVATLVQQVGDIASEVGARDRAIDTIASRGLVALDAVRSRDTQLARGLDQLPATLTSVRNIVNTIGPVSRRVNPVVNNVTAAMRDLRPTIQDLPAASRSGRSLLTELGAASPPLRGTLNRATSLSRTLPQALPALRKTTCEVNPMLVYSKPYFPDALHILMGLGSSSNSYDATGHLIRLAPVGESAGFFSGAPQQVTDARNQLIQSGLLGQLSPINKFNPYPKPGELGRSGAQVGQPQDASAMRASGYTYPRIQAQC